ncbi:LysR substrate-binding domain-containing protein [Aquincola sp. J276]|uniref:LysR substrate-binding domain-containing protein n=1 Tax=Aquincola sp. J276 TaxID=2898432 RepID=UPI002150C984|nr:LysR substrate-binding domain-containing protein [Aquincola sp. J276]MCR5868967.1 LysR substrate-binding domain-containing protein [Aquincola sp. J276]
MSIPLAQLSYLDLLRGFVAVGRRMSITAAAQDLHLTQSAVSRQVIALEERLGVPLLIRGYRSIGLTPAGEQLFREADAALQQLQDVVGDLQPGQAHRPVRVTASVGVTGLWLLPRLKAFQQRHPGVDLRISADNRVLDLRHQGIDLAIRYSAPAAAVPGSTRLFGHRIAPVASPSLGLGRLPPAEWMARCTLLDFDDATYPWLRWSHWLSTHGGERVHRRSTQSFNQYDQVVQAALDGQGVALGRLELMQGLLDDGLLEALAPAEAGGDAAHGYWLIRVDDRPRADVRKVAAWIEDEARATQAMQHTAD